MKKRSKLTLMKKAGLFAISAALAFTTVATPALAFADPVVASDEVGASLTETAPSISANVASVSIALGEQIDVSQYFTFQNPGNVSCHIDYKVTDGTSVGTVNKHKGEFSSAAAGTATVTAYVVEGEQPGGTGTGSGNNQSNPDGIVIAQASIEVIVTATASEYGFQGADITIMMKDSTLGSYTNAYNSVSYVSGDAATGYVNSLGTLTADGNYYYFTVEMTNGFRNYNTPAAFAARNAGQIAIQNNRGIAQASLNGENTGALTVYATDHNTKTFTLRIDKSLYNNNGKLVFLNGFKGNNNTNSLGTTIAFNFSV